MDDKVRSQYARFLEAARKSGTAQGGRKFSAAFKKVVKTKKPPKGSGL